jgi:hypothetical protein
MLDLVAATCTRRAALELHGAAAFTIVTQDLIDLRADARIVDFSARAIAEEVRHAEIYRDLAKTIGTDTPLPRLEPIPIPKYPHVSDRDERMLRVVAMCSINETMACSFLELCLSGATVPHVREAIREVLEDEIKHARIGWAYLGSSDVGARERSVIAATLQPLLRIQWTSWREQIATLPDFDCPSYGCPSGAAIERASLASMRDLVLPGFSRAGIDVTDAVSWLDSHS